jgi:hypothetical protein
MLAQDSANEEAKAFHHGGHRGHREGKTGGEYFEEG